MQSKTGSTHLLSFSRNGISDHILTSDEHNNLGITLQYKARDETWDPVAGTAFSVGGDAPVIHVADQISYPKSSPTVCRWPLVETSDGPSRPRWASIVDQEKAAFGSLHRSQGRVLARIWGQASPRFPSCIATTFSCHPSDQVQMAMRNEKNSSIAICVERDALDLAGMGSCPGSPPPNSELHERRCCRIMLLTILVLSHESIVLALSMNLSQDPAFKDEGDSVIADLRVLFDSDQTTSKGKPSNGTRPDGYVLGKALARLDIRVLIVQKSGQAR